MSGDKKLSLLDVAGRFKNLLRRSLDFIITTGPFQTELNTNLQKFVFSILEYVLMSLSHSIEVDFENGGAEAAWSQLTYLCRENLKWHFVHLAIYIIAPTMALLIREKAINKLAEHNWLINIFRDSIKEYTNHFCRFGIFLHEFLYHQGPHSSETEASCRKLIKSVEDLGIQVLPQPNSTIKQWTVVTDEMKIWETEIVNLTNFIRESYSSSHERLCRKHQTLFYHLCDEANSITTKAVHLQNATRKKVFRRLKYSQYSSVKLTKFWVELTEALCHEKATWNFPESYPRDWKLDPTEGPARIRKKMMRCSLDIPEKFFMSNVARPGKVSAPLQEILLDKEVESPLSHIVESLHEDENLLFTCHALFITPTVEQKGEFLICQKRLYFIGEEMTSQIGNSVPIVITRCWQNDVIIEFYLRRYRLRDCALEIFAASGSAFIVFDCEKDREQVLTNLQTLTYPNMKRKSKLKDFTLLWRDGTLTNFEYLTQLNKFAGRSFSDLMQYPVFPFILKDYDSATLDISNPEIYRDLRKPVPIQSKDREQYFKSIYENTAQMCPDGPYHYSSHYSNSGIVLYYMIRVPPFTQVFLDFQDGSFDVPDRAFHTLRITWKLASSDSTTAIRELIPEFFFLPETFENSQGFNLGLRQNDEIVNHVELPKWCLSNPRRFVLIHRALLESPFVTKNLQHWVDLIFGYKQTGRAAVEAINVFHPATYFGYDIKFEDDEVAVEARKTMIKTYGQTPLQLHKSAHSKPYSSSINYTKPVVGIPPVVKEVSGIYWGDYALSPSDPNPTVNVCRTLHEKLVRLEPLWDNEMAVIQSNTTTYCLNPGYKAPNIYTISWGHNDGILRSKRFTNSIFHPVICHPTYNQVTCGAVIERHLWVGTECGQVMVYALGTDSEELSLACSVLKHPLVAHSAKITSLIISKEFKIAFTGGEDGMVALWDTKWLTYIRSITIAGSAVDLLAVSDTLGDWVVVCIAGPSSSILKYYTINAQFIDSITTSSVIECITFSNAPEGRNVNVIAACLADRTIRLYSSWDLSEVKVIDVTNLAKGLGISIKYTADNASLCMITKSHFLVVWKTSQKKCRDPKFSLNIR